VYSNNLILIIFIQFFIIILLYEFLLNSFYECKIVIILFFGVSAMCIREAELHNSILALDASETKFGKKCVSIRDFESKT
jgi:hypothetical protein